MRESILPNTPAGVPVSRMLWGLRMVDRPRNGGLAAVSRQLAAVVGRARRRLVITLIEQVLGAREPTWVRAPWRAARVSATVADRVRSRPHAHRFGVAGRAYAAYGGIYIAASLIWLWVVEGNADANPM